MFTKKFYFVKKGKKGLKFFKLEEKGRQMLFKGEKRTWYYYKILFPKIRNQVLVSHKKFRKMSIFLILYAYLTK